jgi:predicted DNA-binding transcriptional regulator YafY
MKLHYAIAALQLLPTERAQSITVAEFIERWTRAGQPRMSDRQLQRWLPELELENLVESVETDKGPRKYFRLAHQTPAWAMTQETALRLLVSSHLIERVVKGVGNEGRGVLDLARTVVNTSEMSRRLHKRIRVVPDGIGRLPAKVAPGVQEAIVEAIASSRQVQFVYRSRATMETGGTGRTHQVSVLGAVSKDGATYLLGADGLAGPVLTFALHRMLSAEVLPSPAVDRLDFDLDAYIEQTHQLSHGYGKGEVVELRLRVREDAIWHLTERPLCTQQEVSAGPDSQGWYAVTAPVPWTELLVPTLLSMGEWLVVDGPPNVRDAMKTRLGEAASRYS